METGWLLCYPAHEHTLTYTDNKTAAEVFHPLFQEEAQKKYDIQFVPSVRRGL